MINELLPIVIENGSRMCRAGFSCNDVPQLEFPTVVGYQKSNKEKFNVGEDAEKKIRIIV